MNVLLHFDRSRNWEASDNAPARPDPKASSLDELFHATQALADQVLGTWREPEAHEPFGLVESLDRKRAS